MDSFSSLLRIVYFRDIRSRPFFLILAQKDGRHFRVYHLFTTSGLSARELFQPVKGLNSSSKKFCGGKLEGGRSTASNQINSRQSLALQGLGERSDIFRKYTVLRKIRRFETVKKTFLTVSEQLPGLSARELFALY
jgi:hypothetical protein